MASVNSWQPWFVAVMIFILFVLLVTGVKTPETVAFMCMCIIWNSGIITTQEALAGFSNSGVLAIGVLFVVVQAIERTQLAPWAARNVFGMKTGETLLSNPLCNDSLCIHSKLRFVCFKRYSIGIVSALYTMFRDLRFLEQHASSRLADADHQRLGPHARISSIAISDPFEFQHDSWWFADNHWDFHQPGGSGAG